MSEAESGAGALGTLQWPLAAEDQARADFYALLARLYAGGPDDRLLRAIAAAPALGTRAFVDTLQSKAAQIGPAWEAVRAASSVVDSEAATQEYVDLFVGVGKCEVNLHASHWLTGFMMEKPLADVRADLALLGIGRKAEVTMVEDHLSALFETMRLLIAGHDARAAVDIAQQRRFFERHIVPWIDRCCDAIRSNPIANYYRRVAEFTQCFVALEHDSFVME